MLQRTTNAIYQSFIGILRLLCEIGRVELLTETSLSSHYMVSLRTGQLQQLLPFVKYLKDHNRFKVVFDPSPVNISDHHFPPEERAVTKTQFASEYYPDAIKDIPRNGSPLKRNTVQISRFVDLDHAGDISTRLSQPGILIFLNKTLIMWNQNVRILSQRQRSEINLRPCIRPWK